MDNSKIFFPKITIGAQSAVKTPRIKSFLFEIIPSAFKVCHLVSQRKQLCWSEFDSLKLFFFCYKIF